MVSIPACHAGDRGSILRHGELLFPELEISCSWESTDLKEFYCQVGLEQARQIKAGYLYFDNRLDQTMSTSKLT